TNIYGEEIYKYKSTSTSDQLGYQKKNKIDESSKASISDALTKGLIDFMSQKEVVEALKDNSLELSESKFEPIKLTAASEKVSSLSDAIKSSVTIKTDDSHGSGFFVSSNGHVVTNYHVISQKDEVKVILNDRSEFVA